MNMNADLALVTSSERIEKPAILSTARGIAVSMIWVLNILFWAGPLFTTAFLKLIPIPVWRRFCTILITRIAFIWISINNLSMGVNIKTYGVEKLSMQHWYLVISNHQSWVDIPVLQKAFFGKIPFLKFFLKKELIWVPIMGLAWWALDFPFMKRYSSEFLKKNPHMKGKDLEITRKACEKFKTSPVAVMNFVEGTRFTPSKHGRQGSPYQNLLKPRAGGVSFVLSSMGEHLSSILNVTIHYPDGPDTFWNMLCGRVREAIVVVQEIALNDELRFNRLSREDFESWLNRMWEEKDLLLQRFSPMPSVVPV